MVIKVLSENTSISPHFQAEHGLSLYVEADGRKLLFDTGASELFLENADRLDVDIADVDYVVISHGHFDHGGGLKAFFQHNKKAEVFIHTKAFEEHTARREDGSEEYIGLDQELMHNKRIVFTGDRFFIARGIEVFSNVIGRDMFSQSNRALLVRRENNSVEDNFEHEQNLVIREEDRIALFAGCAHNGIVNITRHFEELKRRHADYVFGGFHLNNPLTNQSESSELLMPIGEYLKATRSTYYTGHCTGDEPYHLLKIVMGDNLQRLATGSVINI